MAEKTDGRGQMAAYRKGRGKKTKLVIPRSEATRGLEVDVVIGPKVKPEIPLRT